MSRQKMVMAAGVVFGIVTITLFAPLVFQGGAFGICGGTAGAQGDDNPCAAQEATIVAQSAQITALQATLTALGVDPVIPTAAPTVAPTLSADQVTPVPPPVTGTNVLTDAFDNNNTGWYLVPDDNTSAGVNDGQLTMSATRGWFRWANAPDIALANFYMQAVINTPDVSSAMPGFLVGNGQSNQYHLFTIGEDGASAAPEWFVKVYEWDGSALSEVSRQSLGAGPLWNAGEFATIGLAGQGGTFTMYLNGSAVYTTPVAVYGNQLGLVFYATVRGAGESASVVFDDLSITQ